MRIDDAQPAHRSAVQAIYDHEVLHSTATFDVTPRSADEWRDWWGHHEQERFPVLVASEQGLVLGWASLSPWATRCAYARANEVSVYVDRAARGRGVGAALLEALVARARALGVGVLLSRIEVSGGDASVRLHRRFGFQDVGVMRRVGEKFGRILDVMIMDLHLDTPTEPEAL
jgi:L-amino acid N-acyltransferase YncA